MDKISKARRSKNMAAIRSQDTKIEVLVSAELARKTYKFERNVKGMPGVPDFVFRKDHLVVFVHGCFVLPLKEMEFEGI